MVLALVWQVKALQAVVMVVTVKKWWQAEAQGRWSHGPEVGGQDVTLRVLGCSGQGGLAGGWPASRSCLQTPVLTVPTSAPAGGDVQADPRGSLRTKIGQQSLAFVSQGPSIHVSSLSFSHDLGRSADDGHLPRAES